MISQPVTRVGCSRLPRFDACPSTLLDDGGSYNPESEASGMGTAAHTALSEFALGREPDVAAIAGDNGVDPGELGLLVRLGSKAWEAVRDRFPEPRVEVPLEGEVVRGRCDLLHTDGERLAILDWDFGWIGTDKRLQLRGYADAARTAFGMPRSGVVETYHVRVRAGTVTPGTLTAEDLDLFRARVSARLKRVGVDFAPDFGTCRFCPRQLRCEALADYSRSAVVALVEAKPAEIVINDATLAALYPKWQQARKACESFDKLLGNRLDAGALELGDGRRLELVAQDREEIDALKAWPILESELTPAEIAGALKVGKTALLDAIKAKAGRGMKGKAADAFLESLRTAGAVTVKSFSVRREVKP